MTVARFFLNKKWNNEETGKAVRVKEESTLTGTYWFNLLVSEVFRRTRIFKLRIDFRDTWTVQQFFRRLSEASLLPLLLHQWATVHEGELNFGWCQRRRLWGSDMLCLLAGFWAFIPDSIRFWIVLHDQPTTLERNHANTTANKLLHFRY